jgi:hypothetical protein
MMPAQPSGTGEYRAPVECPQVVGEDVECIVSGRTITLRDDIAGSMVQLQLRSFDFVARNGRTLRFCSCAGRMSAGAIEFAGLGCDAWYDVTCASERIAEELALFIQTSLEPTRWLKTN